MNIKDVIVISDLHLEWDLKLQDFNQVIDSKMADAVIISGDTAGGTNAIHFIDHLLGLGYVVFYILGNHEFYGYNIKELISEWREIERENFFFLHKDCVEFENCRIIGAPLWASVGTLQSHPIMGYKKQEQLDWFVKQAVKNFGDFDHIPDFSPLVMSSLFWDDFHFIKSCLEEPSDKKTIVMTHHLPTYKSVAEKYQGSLTNNVFATDLDFLFEEHHIDFWIHGHTHKSFDYNINRTRVVCNPRGYKEINQLNKLFEWTKKITI